MTKGERLCSTLPRQVFPHSVVVTCAVTATVYCTWDVLPAPAHSVLIQPGAGSMVLDASTCPWLFSVQSLHGHVFPKLRFTLHFASHLTPALVSAGCYGPRRSLDQWVGGARPYLPRAGVGAVGPVTCLRLDSLSRGFREGVSKPLLRVAGAS